MPLFHKASIAKWYNIRMNTPTPASARIVAAIVLAGGICIIATASILIRFAQSYHIPSLSIAAIRLGISASILSGIVLWRWRTATAHLEWQHTRWALLSGVCLAAHFATWIQSLEYTSVASSAALVSTNPLWVGIAALLIFKERLNGWRIAGMGLTMAGSMLIAISDQQQTSATNPLLGNLLAITGALCGSIYFLIGRGVRAHIPLLPYIWMTYGSAAVTLVVAALAFGFVTLPHASTAWLVLVGLALGPQLLGHTSINFAVRHLSALLVTIALLGEPVGSALLALFLFQEHVASLQLVGLVGLLIGIGIAAYGETKPNILPAQRDNH